MQKNFSLIDDCIREYSDQIDLRFNPGISVSERNLIREQLDAHVPDAFLDLYSWHDGQVMDGGPMFFPYYWMSIDDVKTERIIFSEDFQGISQPASPLWVPFLRTDTGDFICVDPGGYSTGVKNQLISFVHDDGDYTVACFSSIEKWIEYFLLALNEKKFIIDPYSRSIEVYGDDKYLLDLVDPGFPMKI